MGKRFSIEPYSYIQNKYIKKYVMKKTRSVLNFISINYLKHKECPLFLKVK